MVIRSLTDDAIPLAPGEVFAGYTILGMLGRGWMSEVYLGQHPRLSRRDVLKIFPPEATVDNEFRRRFNREADITASLWHPNIRGFHDRGEFNGRLWLSLDYVEGIDAAQLMRDRYPDGMPYEEAAEIILAIAAALDYAYQEGLLHRDVSPANILLTLEKSMERRIQLADFGRARGLDETNGLAETSMTIGSASYAAPEQHMRHVMRFMGCRGLRQLSNVSIDGRADQYALACTAFHLLSGVPPFRGSNPTVIIGRHLSLSPPKISSWHSEMAPLDHPLSRAMAKHPRDRYATCTDFAKDFYDCAASIADRTTAVCTTQGAPIGGAMALELGLGRSRHKLIAPLSGATIAAILAGLGIGVISFVIANRRGSKTASRIRGMHRTRSSEPTTPSPNRLGMAASEMRGLR